MRGCKKIRTHGTWGREPQGLAGTPASRSGYLGSTAPRPPPSPGRSCDLRPRQPPTRLAPAALLNREVPGADRVSSRLPRSPGGSQPPLPSLPLLAEGKGETASPMSPPFSPVLPPGCSLSLPPSLPPRGSAGPSGAAEVAAFQTLRGHVVRWGWCAPTPAGEFPAPRGADLVPLPGPRGDSCALASRLRLGGDARWACYPPAPTVCLALA